MSPGGVKKGDKIHGQKKGKKGEAAAYITRAQAVAMPVMFKPGNFLWLHKFKNQFVPD